LFRALESPAVAHPVLPYRKPTSADRPGLVDACLRNVSHFPQLWVAAQHREPGPVEEEYHGILLELAAWLRHYRDAILLIERNRSEWPWLADAFERVIWSDLHRRLTAYLSSRMRAHLLAAPGDPAVVARFTLDALVACQVTGPVALPSAGPEADEVLVGLVAGAVVRSGRRPPFTPEPRQNPAV
jgi:hypothetical protein